MCVSCLDELLHGRGNKADHMFEILWLNVTVDAFVPEREMNYVDRMRGIVDARAVRTLH